MADAMFGGEADSQLRLENLQSGATVRDSEGRELGSLVKVYRNADYGVPPPAAAPKVIEPYLEVRSDAGMFWVPLSQVSEVTRDGVRLNLLRDRVHTMGFDQKPGFLQG